MNGLNKKPDQTSGSTPRRPETLAKSHLAHSSIRGQTARQKQKLKEQQRTETGTSNGVEEGKAGATIAVVEKKGQAGTGNKPFVKAVLANPLAPPWPELAPENAQSISAALTHSFPGVAAFHLARGRLSSKEKQRVKKALNKEKKKNPKGSPCPVHGRPKGDVKGKKRALSSGGEEEQEDEGGRASKRLKVEEEVIEVLDSDEEQNSGVAGQAEMAVEGDELGMQAGTEVKEAEDEEEEEEEQIEVRPTAAPNPDQPAPGTPKPVNTTLLPERPTLLDSVVCGINEVFKKMERQNASLAQEVEDVLQDKTPGVSTGDGVFSLSALMATGVETSSPALVLPEASSSKIGETMSTLALEEAAPVRIIFVCRGDIDPVDLIDPLLLYVTSWNALVRNCRARLQTRMREVKQKQEGKEKEDGGMKAFWDAAVKALIKTEEVYLVPLPKGAEMDLAAAVGLRRVAVMALTTSFPCVKTFVDKLNVLKVRPPLPSFPVQPYDPTTTPGMPLFASARIKAVQTTVPKDPKSRKAQRIEEVKAKRLERKQALKDRKTLEKKQGTLINGKLRGGTDAKERKLAEQREQATEKNRTRQKKLKEKKREREQAGAAKGQSGAASLLIPVQPPSGGTAAAA